MQRELFINKLSRQMVAQAHGQRRKRLVSCLQDITERESVHIVLKLGVHTELGSWFKHYIKHPISLLMNDVFVCL